MAEKIRLVKDADDIKKIERLFEGQITTNVLDWLLKNPQNPSEYCAYVAEDKNGGLIGVLGFVLSNYKYGNKTISGVIPMSWKVSRTYKGLSGILLLKKAISLGDFGLAIQGSEKAQKLYALASLRKVGIANTYIKLLNPVNYLISLSGRKLIRMLGNFLIVLPSYIRFKRRKKNKQLEINEISVNEMDKEVPYLQENCLEKEITIPYIKWLASCPKVKSFVLEVTYKNQFLGYSVCYICEFAKKTKRGRIVYMPNLSQNKGLLEDALCIYEKFFRQKKCASFSVLGFDKNTKKAIENMGYANYKNKQKPIYIKDPQKLFSEINMDNWFMQYTEGDKAYRNI